MFCSLLIVFSDSSQTSSKKTDNLNDVFAPFAVLYLEFFNTKEFKALSVKKRFKVPDTETILTFLIFKLVSMVQLNVLIVMST